MREIDDDPPFLHGIPAHLNLHATSPASCCNHLEHQRLARRSQLLCFTSIIAKQLIAKSMFSRIFPEKISAVPINCKQLIAKIMFSRFFKSKILKIKRNQKKSKVTGEPKNHYETVACHLTQLLHHIENASRWPQTPPPQSLRPCFVHSVKNPLKVRRGLWPQGV